MSGTAAASATGEVTSQSVHVGVNCGARPVDHADRYRHNDAHPGCRGQRVEGVTEEVEHRGVGRPRRARVPELVEELRHPRRKGCAARQSVEQRGFQARPRAPPKRRRQPRDNGCREQVQAVVLEVQHCHHESAGGYPVAAPGPLVSQHEAGDCEDGRKHQPRVHACLAAVIVQVGACRDEGSQRHGPPYVRRACHPTTRRPVLRAAPRSSRGHGLPGQTCRTAVASSAASRSTAVAHRR